MFSSADTMVNWSLTSHHHDEKGREKGKEKGREKGREKGKEKGREKGGGDPIAEAGPG